MFRIMAGYLWAVAVMSLYQDYWGKAKYLQMVEDGWIDAEISVPAALGMIVVAIILQWNTTESVNK